MYLPAIIKLFTENKKRRKRYSVTKTTVPQRVTRDEAGLKDEIQPPPPGNINFSISSVNKVLSRLSSVESKVISSFTKKKTLELEASDKDLELNGLITQISDSSPVREVPPRRREVKNLVTRDEVGFEKLLRKSVQGLISPTDYRYIIQRVRDAENKLLMVLTDIKKLKEMISVKEQQISALKKIVSSMDF